MGRIKEIKHIRTILIVVAVIIAISSLLVSHSFVRDLEREERNKMEVFAEAYRTFNNADENTDLSLVLEVIPVAKARTIATRKKIAGRNTSTLTLALTSWLT